MHLTRLSRSVSVANSTRLCRPQMRLVSKHNLGVGNGPRVKESTGIAGVPVVPRAREILMRAYEKYLTELEQFEQGTPFREHMEKMISWRLDVCRSTEDPFEIEEKINAGQLEELLHDIEDDFHLIPFMLEHKPWEKKNKWDSPSCLFSNIRC